MNETNVLTHRDAELRSRWGLLAPLAGRLLSTSADVTYLAVGAVTMFGQSLGAALADAAVWLRSDERARQPAGTCALSVRHTLRIVYGETEGAQPFAGLGGATHMIVWDPNTPYAQASLAHEFAHVLLAVVRDAPAQAVGYPENPAAPMKSVVVQTEECAAWALARAITRGEIWGRAALDYRQRALQDYGLPAWASAPRITPPCRRLVRWLAQVAH